MSNIVTTISLQSYMPTVTLNATIAGQVCNAVNAYVDTYTKRVFGEKKQVTERYDMSYTFYLRHADIITIDSMTLGWPGTGQNSYSVQSTAYFFNVFGRVTLFAQFLPWDQQRTPSMTWRDYLSVQYTYGYTGAGYAQDGVTPLVPDDLSLASHGIAAGFYNWATNGNKDVVATSVGSYKLEFVGAVRGVGNGVPAPANNTSEANWAILDSYRLRRG